MIAAVYARKSTEQIGVSDEEKSVTRQIEHAKAYAKRKGWHVAKEHIYSDDGISGAEFVKRPGFIRLMNALKPKPPFQVLIMSEESRLGRESIETAYTLKQLICAGVRMFFYLEDRERTLDSPTEKIMLQLTNFADEVERERARVRTYDAMVPKAKAGHVTGGRVFGYDNVDIPSAVVDAQGQAKRSHVELRINEAEAEIVRKIFRLYAEGRGFTTIAKTLNAEGAPCPRPRPAVGKPNGWVSSSVRVILLRRLYKGEQVWGRTKKRDKWGQLKPHRRPEQDWLIVPVPHLQIVPNALWVEAQERWRNNRQFYLRATNGRLHGRPVNGKESPYLFTGFTACQHCGGSLYVRSHRYGTRRTFHYACTTHYQRGPEKCPEPMLMPMALVDRAILEQIEHDVLQPSVVAKAIERAVRLLHDPGEQPDARREALQKELQHLKAELARLTMAIAAGGTLQSLLTAVQEREARQAGVQAELALLDGVSVALFNAEQVEEEMRRYLMDWSQLGQRHPAQTRQILRKLLPEKQRITVRHEGHGRYRFSGVAVLGGVFKGFVVGKYFGVPNGI